MTERRLLVIEDASFYEFLERELVARGFDIHFSADAEEGLDDIVRRSPDVVFIPVDLPDSAGFGLFTRARARSRKVRVVMVTGTLPPGDLLLHQKLKVHADLYLDKRSITPEELENGIARVLAGPNGGPITEHPRELGRGAGPGEQAGSEWLEELIGEEAAEDISSALSVLGGDWTSSGSDAPPADADGETASGASLRERQLKLEVERLSEELEEVQRAARSTPFSSDFLTLQSEMGQKRAEVARLKGELIEREHAISGLKKIIDQVRARVEDKRASELAAAEEKHAQDRERLLAAAEKRLQLALEDARRERDQELEALRTENEKLRSSDAEEHQLALEESRERMERALEDAAREKEGAIERLLKQHADEKRQVIAAERERLQQALDSASASREAALDELRATHTRETQDLCVKLEGAVAEGQRSIAAEREKIQQGMEQLKRDYEAALVKAREEHADEIAMIQAEHEEALAATSRQCEQAIADRLAEAKRRSEDRIEALTRLHHARTGELEANQAKELANLREDHEVQLAVAVEKALASRADPAELERLQEKLARLQEQLEHAREEIAAQEAQLAEQKQTIESLEVMVRDTFQHS